MLKRYILILLLLPVFCATVQAKKVRALFLGNSYTDVNNLPELVRQLALSTGDTLEFSKNTPGGYTLQGHSTNTTSLGMIAAGNWDFVVLQEQSQLPSFPEGQVAAQVYPYAKALDSLIKVSNPCATTLFYMTWGRKNGDASNCPNFPVVCTYEGMDSMLQLRYTTMASDNAAAIAPVAKVWRKLRAENASIELYTSDESHPSNNGSFAAACSFYAILFDKNPELTTYNFSVGAGNAAIIKSAARAVVFDSLDHWNRFVALPMADFDFTVSGSGISTINNSEHADAYFWNFGDGFTSSNAAPTHTYAASGTYDLMLVARDTVCGKNDTLVQTVNIEGTDIRDVAAPTMVTIFPNPANEILTIQSSSSLNSLSIYDLNGSLRLNKPLLTTANEHNISIANLSTGVYQLLLHDKAGQKAGSLFVKQ